MLFFSLFLVVLTDSYFRNHSDELIQRFRRFRRDDDDFFIDGGISGLLEIKGRLVFIIYVVFFFIF